MKHSFRFGLLMLVGGLLFVGCASKPTIDINKPPKMQVPKKATPIVRRKGSLFTRKGSSLFSDKKDLQIGDIIQVIVSETLTNDSKNTRDMTNTNTSRLGAGLFSSKAPSTANTTKKLNSAVGLGFNSTSSSKFSGSAVSKADEKFSTTISAIITQTYQNGNYFIQGSKEMLINGQKQNVKISGVIRPYDITPENTVYSYQVANLKILYKKDGEENDVLEKPWGTRFLEAIWPF